MTKIVFGRKSFTDKFNASDFLMEKLDLYICLLTEWQKRMNIVSKKSFEHVWERHILDSIQLSHFIGQETKTIVDLGSGGGFPGLILALNFLECGGPEIHLIEANKKKALFLIEANKMLNSNVVVHADRLETISNLKADVLTARALAPLENLLGLAYRFLNSESECLFLKGESYNREVEEAEKKWRMQISTFDSISKKGSKILKIKKLCPYKND